MAVSFKVPKSPKKNIFVIDEFLGVDMTNNGTSVDEKMSPNAPNMIREVPGKVRKRMGYRVLKDFGGGTIYGAHVLEASTTIINDAVTNKNMASASTANFSIRDNTSVYICSKVEIPVGVGVHVSFKYKTDREVHIHPYIGDYSECDYALDSLNIDSDFSRPFGFDGQINEVYNAFEITNTSGATANVKLSEIMIYINQDVDKVLTAYDAFQKVKEMSLYSPNSSTYSETDMENNISSSTESVQTAFTVNTHNISGLVQVDYDISVENISGSTFDSLKVEYNCDKDDDGTTVTEVISTVDSSTNPTLHVSRVIDPAYNHSAYNLTTSKLTDLIVTVNVKTAASWTGKVKIKNFSLTGVDLREDYTEVSGLTLIHVDNEIYKADGIGNYSLLSTEMNERRSKSWQFGNKLYIVDGRTFWVYDSDQDVFTRVVNSTYAKIPLMYISCAPEGGGTQYEGKNLLSDGFEQRFTCDSSHSTTKTFQLIFKPLTNQTVTAKVMSSGGTMVDKVEGTDFSVNRTTGVVTFNVAPGTTPVTGEDNVYITAYYAATAPMSSEECISRCSIGTLFGINGATDRLFLSGNPEFPNADWYSEQYDPGYFPDTSYAKLGRDISAIVGYTLVNNYLAAHKDEKETEHNVIVREGDLVAVGETSKDNVTTYDEKPAFKVINTLQGPGAIACDTFGYLQTEPLFLTRSGIFSITAQDITGEKYAQNRSFYVNGALLKEANLEGAYAVTFNDMYFLFVNSKIYVLDGLQALPTERGEPYATRQYVCYYLTNIPATIAWVWNNTLYFGTSNGKVCCFYKDDTDVNSYNDDSQPIQAWWETVDLDGKLFYKNKSFRYIAVRLLAELYSTVTLYSCRRGIWTKIKEKNFSNKVFTFSGLVFSEFTFNNDASDPVMSSKMRVKKIDKARFKIENSNLNQPFGIHDLAVEYIESGNFRG